MSASDKKKLRKEQSANLLSDKQRQQRAEAKKLKIYTISFVSAMVLVVCVALGVLGVRAVNNSGLIQRNTIAATIGDRKINSVELSYYFNDAVRDMYNEWYGQYSNYTDSYLQIQGLDTSKPLDTQIQNNENGTTWAQYFVNEAIKQAKSDYALYDLAMEEGFTLPDEDRTTLENTLNNIETYATLYGYSSGDQYLRASYGYGSDVKSYSEYFERSTIATAYYNAHKDSLTYDDAAMREYEADKFTDYSSYTYASVYMSYSYFLQGGTEDEDGNVTYSDAEKDAARAAVKAAADELVTATSVEELRTKAAAVKVNEGSTIAVENNERVLHSTISTALSDWLASEERTEGDIAAIPNTSTSENEAGEEVTVTNGYYVIIFQSRHDNTEPMANVRHLLVSFEGGTEDEETGEKVYSDEEKASAKAEAEGYLKTWQEGDATEESFIELVKEHSDDSSAEDGGLFEDIHPDSNYVPNFLNWAISAERKAGDAEVIETEYGYHVMYYVGDDELSYRDYMISNEMRAADQEEWYNGVLEPITATQGDISKMSLDLIINPNT